ncbi:hypothetical protein LCGC14_0525910 [marine sediment metagenome]|uniref:Blue (type 1) copper domain-containing protein n=1 Tax=marine sediment metagenome TaxID=412755 RepID=A0A0F9SFG5_9ZZZZ|nr:hypothetical protein [Actinomycetota bacterium]
MRFLRIASIILIIVTSITIIGCQTSTTAPGNKDKTQVEEPKTTTSEESADESESKSKDDSEVNADIKIVNFSFDPAKHKIKKGDRVIWQNGDSATHTVTSDEQDVFDSGNLAQGKTFTQKFDDRKTIKYHCEIHPNMKAEITVE